MANEKDVNIPAAPAALPAGLQKKWASTYASAFQQAKADDENAGAGDCHQVARKEANRLLRVEEPASHKEAMELPNWHVMHREEAAVKDKEGKEIGRVLNVVTIDGKKYKFDAPKKDEKK